jgi:cysteine-rich repeat protein
LHALAATFAVSAVALLVQVSMRQETAFRAQSGGDNIPINIFTEQQTNDGFIAKADEHNIFTTSASPAAEMNILDDTDLDLQMQNGTRFYIYQYTGEEANRQRAGTEPVFNGEFFLSNAVLEEDPQLAPLNTLTKIRSGKVYYVMSEAPLVAHFQPARPAAVQFVYSCGNDAVEPEQRYLHLQLNHDAEECDGGASCDNQCRRAAQICGNGHLESSETCDDANTNGGDGCSALCHEEPGFICGGEPSQCQPIIPTLNGSSPPPPPPVVNSAPPTSVDGPPPPSAPTPPTSAFWTEAGTDVLPASIGIFASAVSHNGSMYLLGGSTAQGQLLNDVYKSQNGIDWTRAGSMPAGVTRATAFSYDGKIFVIGGINSNNNPRLVLSSPDGVTWTTSNDALPVGLHTLAGVIAPIGPGSLPRMVIIGGTVTPANTYVYSRGVYWSGNGSSWTPASGIIPDASLPIGTSDHCALRFSPAAGQSEKYWVIGGINAEDAGSNRRVYSSYDARAWTREPDLPEPIRSAACVTAQSKMWILGGSSATSFYKDTAYTSTNGSTWTASQDAKLPQGRYGHAALSFGGRIWVFGGIVQGTTGGSLSRKVYFSPLLVSDGGPPPSPPPPSPPSPPPTAPPVPAPVPAPVAPAPASSPSAPPPAPAPVPTPPSPPPVVGDWTRVTVLPPPIRGPETAYAPRGPIVFFKDKIFVLGGLDANGLRVRDVYTYTPSTNAWNKVGMLPDARYYFSAAVLGNRLVIAGGYGGENWTYATDDGATWDKLSSFPIPIFNAASAVANGKLYIMGGQTVVNGASRYSTAVYSFSYTSGWRQEPNLPQPISFAAGTTYKNRPVFVGGFVENSLARSKKVYSLNDFAWQEGTPEFPQSRYSHGVVSLSGDRLLIIGGTTSLGEYTEEEPVQSLLFNGTSWSKVSPLPFVSGVFAAQNGDTVWVELSDGGIYRWK